MRIVFVSHHSIVAATGPTYSVPQRIEAQSKVDDVLWIDTSRTSREEWAERSYYHHLSGIGELTYNSIVQLFPDPDVVVMECFYNMKQVKLAKDLRKHGIPYIVVPRSSLTYKALHNHSWLKKKIGHWIYFNSYCRHALAIQYLTEREYKDSGDRWNQRRIIIPNGTIVPDYDKEWKAADGIEAIYVGRMDIYQKGIDELLDACSHLSNFLHEAHFKLTLYGPFTSGFEKIKMMVEEKRLSSIVHFGGPVFGVEKEKVLKNADLFILTSRFEGHPMGLIEALAYELPVLVTPGTNMSEEVRNANAGWICDAEANSIADSLQEIVRNKSLFAQKGCNARRLARKYDWDNLAVSFHEELQKLLGR